MKNKKRMLYAMYLTVLFLTLCVLAFSIIWALIEPQAPGASGLSLDRGFAVYAICILSIPLLIAEFEIFYCAKYFLLTKRNKKSMESCVNIVFCVLSVVLPLFAAAAWLFWRRIVDDVSVALLLLWMLAEPIYRLLHLLYTKLLGVR
ncbi:MAG: hypothetical protein IKA06_06950 [Clostridia bacterium]|nr:hypothetical protein [Clostridia bacterium]